MDAEQKNLVVTEHFEEFCKKVAAEVGTQPVGAIMVLEWPDSSGLMAAQMLPNLDWPMMLKVIDSLSRKFAGTIQRMKTMVNTQKAPVVKKETVQ